MSLILSSFEDDAFPLVSVQLRLQVGYIFSSTLHCKYRFTAGTAPNFQLYLHKSPCKFHLRLPFTYPHRRNSSRLNKNWNCCKSSLNLLRERSTAVLLPTPSPPRPGAKSGGVYPLLYPPLIGCQRIAQNSPSSGIELSCCPGCTFARFISNLISIIIYEHYIVSKPAGERRSVSRVCVLCVLFSDSCVQDTAWEMLAGKPCKFAGENPL